MVRKAKGPRHGTRNKMVAKSRPKPSEFLKQFAVGDRVHVVMKPNIKSRGYPYVKFAGATGEVIEKRGNAYLVRISDKDAKKTLILNPVHLRKQTNS
jgi:large subunit ribosomal protein L21e